MNGLGTALRFALSIEVPKAVPNYWATRARQAEQQHSNLLEMTRRALQEADFQRRDAEARYWEMRAEVECWRRTYNTGYDTSHTMERLILLAQGQAMELKRLKGLVRGRPDLQAHFGEIKHFGEAEEE